MIFQEYLKNTNNNLQVIRDLYDKIFPCSKDYIKFLKKDVERINKKTKDLTGVFLFGAHVFSQYLINLGLNTMNIINILILQQQAKYNYHMVKDCHTTQTLYYIHQKKKRY